jgi:hypothetical protein
MLALPGRADILGSQHVFQRLCASVLTYHHERRAIPLLWKKRASSDLVRPGSGLLAAADAENTCCFAPIGAPVDSVQRNIPVPRGCR